MPTFKDQLKRSVNLRETPTRIISLVPSITELLYDLGLEEEVVGVTKFCEYPANWRKEKTIVGGTKNIRFEEIEKLHPDLIIANKEENDKDSVEKLMESYPVWMSDIKNYADAIEMIELLSTAIGKKSNADQLIKNIQLAKEKLDEVTPKKKPSVAYIIWKDPLMVAGGDTYISNMLELAGATNLFSNQNRYPTISPEKLQAAAPDFLLLSSEPFPFKQKDFPHFEKICPNAVIKLVDGTYFSWYGSRMLPAMQYFHNFREEINTDA